MVGTHSRRSRPQSAQVVCIPTDTMELFSLLLVVVVVVVGMGMGGI